MRSPRYSNMLARGKKVIPIYPVDAEFADKVLAYSDEAISQIVEHRADKHATEYWIFHKSLLEKMPNKDLFNIVENYNALTPVDAPCWALTDNGYVVYIPVIVERKTASGKHKSYAPKTYFAQGIFTQKPKTLYKHFKQVTYFQADITADIDKKGRIIQDINRQMWIGGSADKDPRLKKFI